MAAQRTITKRTNKERREESMRNILDHAEKEFAYKGYNGTTCLLYTSPSPRDRQKSRMPSSA